MIEKSITKLIAQHKMKHCLIHKHSLFIYLLMYFIIRKLARTIHVTYNIENKIYNEFNKVLNNALDESHIS